MKKFIPMISAAFFFTGCTEAVPIVSNFNGSSVKIQTSALTIEGTAQKNGQAEADRICGKVNKKAEYASTRVLPDYMQESLYLCL